MRVGVLWQVVAQFKVLLEHLLEHLEVDYQDQEGDGCEDHQEDVVAVDHL